MKAFSSRTMWTLFFVAVAISVLPLQAADVEIPKSFDDRLIVELVAQEPQIVTPTGIAVDARGRIWVIENNTHFTPRNYKGFATDRIQIFDDYGPDGRARKVSTFADGFKNSMGLVLGNDGAVFFAMRNEILLLRDTKSAGVADERKTLIKLDTAGDYPHNGLAGLALGPDGKLYFGLGENLGKPYTITGSDGVTLKGGGEGGNVYRCNLDGSKMEIIATGFWNPWGLGFDAYGRLFAVDNDPDSRPPCRLLHVVEGGDYGYRFKYGRKGIHPFVAWNGEIPGTLPMVSGTGEAPCGIYFCDLPPGTPKSVHTNGKTPDQIVTVETHGMPSDYWGDLLVTCWADNVIQRFKLVPEGASVTSRPEELIKGGTNFRPVGIAAAPDGSLIVSDWANASYPVHGHGRIWRIRLKTPINVMSPEAMYSHKAKATDSEQDLLKFVHEDSLNARLDALLFLKEKNSSEAVLHNLAFSDPFLFSAAVNTLARLGDIDLLLKHADDGDPRVRLGILLALRKNGNASGKTPLEKWLVDPDVNVRFAAIQWVGEEGLKEFNPTLHKVIGMPMNTELFKAVLATQSLLSGDKPDKGEYIESQMAQIFPSDKHPAHFRALALKNLRVDHPGMKVTALKPLLESKDAELRTEAIRALALHPQPDAQVELRALAGDAGLDVHLRADAIAGLARSAGTSPETKALLLAMLKDGVPLELQREALRSLRAAAAQPDVMAAMRAYAEKIPAIPAEMRSEMAEQVEFVFHSAGIINDLPQFLTGQVGQRPRTEAEWATALAKPGAPVDVLAGERIFYHTRGAQCFTCHRINGRGGNIGPDLSPIGNTTARDKILTSIIDPSRDVAPQFVQWMLVLKDGRHLSGVIVEENDGVVHLGETSGKVTKIRVPDIDRRSLLKGSVMPDKLVDLLTQQELRDLIAFLIANGNADGK